MFKDDDDEEDNSFGVTRYPCMPSLVALQQMRNRLHLASLGKKLMKWTAVAAMTELRNIAQQIDNVYKNFSEDMCEAFIMVARCRYFNPSLNEMVIEGCPGHAEIGVTTSMRTASGVKIIKYEVIENNTHPYEHLGIGKGGQMILDTKKHWLELLKRIILMVELRKNFKLVEEMQKSANKRLNVLSKSVMPRAMLSIRYILFELEEMEREDNFRLKRFKELKIKKQTKNKSEKEEMKTEAITAETPPPLDVKFDDKIEEKPSIELKEVEQIKENLEITKIEESMKGPDTNVKEPNIDVKEPNMEVKEANINMKEPNIDVKEPNIDVKEPNIDVKEPNIEVKEANINIKESGINAKEPNIDAKEANVNMKEPSINIKEPNITVKEPNIDVKQPMTNVKEPTTNVKEPSINVNDVKETDISESKNQREYKTHTPYIDQPWDKSMDEAFCKCSPLYMTTQEVCQAEITDINFKQESAQKIKETTQHKEEEIKIAKSIPSCSSQMLLASLKKILEEIVSKCVCKFRNQKDDDAAYSQNIRKYSTEFSKLSVDDSTFSVNSKAEDKLGSYESKYKETIKVSRLTNEDGTVRQKRKIVTVRTDKRHPVKTKHVNTQSSINDNQNLVCSCSDSSSESGGSTNQNKYSDEENKDENDRDKGPELIYQATDTKSEPVCSKCMWDKTKLRSCMSTGSLKNIKKMNTITCSYPSDRRVNITINDKGCEVKDNIKETRLPLVSSISVNFCDLPKSVMLDLRDCQGPCTDTNQSSKYVIDEDLSKPEPKKSASTCVCDLENNDNETDVNLMNEVEAMFKNAATGMTSTAYIFNNVIVSSTNHSDDNRKNTCLQPPDFSYIFSKVEKVRHDLLDKKIEESHPAVNTDNFFKECSTRTTMFAYMFSSYQRNEIDNMVKRACSDVPEFPYIFSKTSTKTPSIATNTKSVEIGDLFNNACKHSYSCTYIFNHLKNIQINAMIKHSCMNKVEFPYIFSTVKTEIEDQPNKDVTLRTAEIENMFKNIRKPDTDFTYILNHVNTVKIDNMFKEACKRSEHFPYVFSNVLNEHDSTDTLQKIHEMVNENCKQSCNFPYIFSSSKNVNTNYLPCKNMKKKGNVHSYIFSKVSEAILRNNEDFKNTCKQTCALEKEFSAVINFVFKKSIQNFHQESLPRLKEISDMFKESVRSVNSGKYKFKYVYKNEVSNDVDKKTSTDIIYIYTICDASTATDDVDCGANNSGVTALLKQTCKHRSECTYFPNVIECRKADVVQRASDSTLQDIRKIFKDPCDCIFNNINTIDIKVLQKEDKCNSKCGTSDSTNDAKIEDLERPSEIINVVDINTMFKDSCVRKNEFTYVLNKPTNKQSCELARRTTDLRLQQMSQFENSNKNDWRNFNTTNIKETASAQFKKTTNLIRIDNMFKDSCVQKNSFTYVISNLEDKVSCELARRTSDLRRREIEKLCKDSKRNTCGYDSCVVCNPDRCLNPNYIKIDNMIKKACTQKNEFTYVSTKLGKKPVQLARRTSHLRLHEISKIIESKSRKVAESELQSIVRSKTDFTSLLRKALESMDMIRSNCEKYRNVATFYDTSVFDNDYKYLINKLDQAKTSGFIESACEQKIQINKMIKDSCVTSTKQNYNYIFQKVAKPCICVCDRKKLGLTQPCSVSYSEIGYEQNKPCKIESQSTCSLLFDKRKHRFLIHIPNSKDDSGTLGIEVMWKSGGVADKNIGSKSTHTTTSKRSMPRIPGKSESKIKKKSSWCRGTCNKSNEAPQESNDVSLIRRMLDSVKNVYVPFLKPSVSEVKKEVAQPKADNVVSMMSNSTTSTYSWKSCVMKTCQADIECVEKNISYSGFSYGSSLDFVSYKSEGVGSDINSAIECANVDASSTCKQMKKSNTTEKLLTFDIEMKSGSSLNLGNSVISVKRSHSIKFDADPSVQCPKCGRIKYKPKKKRSKCNLAQNRQVYRLTKSPKPSCTRKLNTDLKRSCSCISIAKCANEPKADYWYNLKRKKLACTSTDNVTNKCKQPVRKCRSYDDNDSSCSKNNRNFL